MMLRRGSIVLLLLTACGGGHASSAAPVDLATTSEGAVRAFLQAVSDSNITRMAHFWGAGSAPASVTRQPTGYEQRLTVTQIYLRNSPYKILASDPVTGDPNRVQVNVSFTRSDTDGTTCTRSAPITVINTGKHGWIVTSLDLTLLGTPGQACKTPKQAS